METGLRTEVVTSSIKDLPEAVPPVSLAKKMGMKMEMQLHAFQTPAAQ